MNINSSSNNHSNKPGDGGPLATASDNYRLYVVITIVRLYIISYMAITVYHIILYH